MLLNKHVNAYLKLFVKLAVCLYTMFFFFFYTTFQYQSVFGHLHFNSFYPLKIYQGKLFRTFFPLQIVCLFHISCTVLKLLLLEYKQLNYVLSFVLMFDAFVVFHHFTQTNDEVFRCHVLDGDV